MSDWPHLSLPPLSVISPVSEEAYGSSFLAANVGVLASAAAHIQHASFEAMLYPFFLDMAVTVVKLWVVNGATTAGNFDLGVYDEQWNLIVSAGSTAQTGTDVLQEVDITDTQIGPGDYWMAMSVDTPATATFYALTGGAATDEEWFPAVAKIIGDGSDFPLGGTALNPQKDNNTTPRIALYGAAFSTVI